MLPERTHQPYADFFIALVTVVMGGIFQFSRGSSLLSSLNQFSKMNKFFRWFAKLLSPAYRAAEIARAAEARKVADEIKKARAELVRVSDRVFTRYKCNACGALHRGKWSGRLHPGADTRLDVDDTKGIPSVQFHKCGDGQYGFSHLVGIEIVPFEEEKPKARTFHCGDAKVRAIPSDFPVQPARPGDIASGPSTCGYCGLSWDDSVVTSLTPAPSGRCPFEHFHVYPEE